LLYDPITETIALTPFSESRTEELTPRSGLHGYSHENPTAMSVEQQRDILERTFKQLTDFCGKPPVGSVAPWWEVSKEATEMLLDKGILYGAFGLI